MPNIKGRTTRRVANRTRGTGPIVVKSTLERTEPRPQTENTRLCPACGRYIKMLKDSALLYSHKKHKNSSYRCPGF